MSCRWSRSGLTGLSSAGAALLRDATLRVGRAGVAASDALVSAAGGRQHLVADSGHAGLVRGALGKDHDGQILRRHIRPRCPESAFPGVAAVFEYRQPKAPATVVEEA